MLFLLLVILCLLNISMGSIYISFSEICEAPGDPGETV